jgi:O-antigen/teichoic acid export membrane protein
MISALRWAAMARLLMLLITWSSTIIAVRILTPADYGIVTIATLLSNYLTMLSEAGFASAIVQRQVRDRATLSAVFSLLLITCVVLAGVVFIAAPLIGTVFDEPRAISLMRLTTVQFALIPFATVAGAALRIDLRFKELGMANIAGAVMSAVAVVGLALLGAGPYALVGGLLLGQTSRVSVLLWRAKAPIVVTTALSPTLGLLRYSTVIVVARTAFYLYTQADNAIVARFLGTSILGSFTVAKSIVQAPLDRIAEVINAVSFPAYSRIKQHEGALSEAFLKSVRVGSYVVFPLFWGLGTVAEPLVAVAFGQKWSGAVLPMQILSIAMPLRLLQTVSSPLMNAIGRPGLTLTFTISAALVIIPLQILGVMNFGVAGAAAGWAIGYPLVYIYSVWLFTRPLSLKPSKVWFALIRPTLCSALMAGLVVLTVYGLLGDARPWLQLIAGIGIGALSYVASFALLDRAAFRELSGLMLSFLRK